MIDIKEKQNYTPAKHTKTNKQLGKELFLYSIFLTNSTKQATSAVSADERHFAKRVFE
jgi:hypothetical protein